MALFADTQYFYPRSPCGERPFKDNCSGNCQLYFYPRSPCGERRHWQMGHRRARHFYPRSPCGERLYNRVNNRCAHCISIHALLAESDQLITRKVSARLIFLSTLSLRRATSERWQKLDVCIIFLSTLSLRRATSERWQKLDVCIIFLSTLSLRRATPFKQAFQPVRHISIHALLAESDCGCGRLPPYHQSFLSTLSLRRATWNKF